MQKGGQGCVLQHLQDEGEADGLPIPACPHLLGGLQGGDVETQKGRPARIQDWAVPTPDSRCWDRGPVGAQVTFGGDLGTGDEGCRTRELTPAPSMHLLWQTERL